MPSLGMMYDYLIESKDNAALAAGKADSAVLKADLVAELVNTNNQILEKFFGSGVIATHKILAATDFTEYSALNADKKKLYDLVISCGFIDMTYDTFGYNLLLAWIFPEGKATHTSILALLT